MQRFVGQGTNLLRGHTTDIGNGKKMCRGAEQISACRAHPDRYGGPRVIDGDQHFINFFVGKQRAFEFTQDERLRPIGC